MRVAHKFWSVAVAAGVIVSVTAPAAALPSIPDTGKQYWFGNYQISKVWALGATGRGVTVAVLDSGIQANRPELAGVVLPGTDFLGGDGRTDTDEPNGHGTSMAIMIAGQGGGPNDLTGIAPEAKILPVTTNKANSDQAAEDVNPRSIRYAVDHGARILSISLAADATNDPDHCPPAVADAVRYAIDKGAIVVAAAGNFALEGNPPDEPAACPGVLAVGAIDGSKRPWVKSERQSYVDVAAPGVNIAAQNLAGESGLADGTSASTALVSGAAALVWSKFPTLTNRQVVARLLATVSDDAGTPGKDDVTGYGIVRPYNAIVTNVAANAPNPVFDEPKTAAPTTSAPSSTPPPSTGPSTGPSASSSTASGGSSSSPVIWIVIGAVAVVIIAIFVGASRHRARAGAG